MSPSHSANVYELFLEQVARRPDKAAVRGGESERSYAELAHRVDQVACFLTECGVGLGDRVAVLSENRVEYLELVLACARIGAVAACANWRLASAELEHCLKLVAPKLLIHSSKYAQLADSVRHAVERHLELDEAFEAALETGVQPSAPPSSVDWEAPLLLLYTSGTTGLPKAATLSHRALVARRVLLQLDLGIDAEDVFVAWAPMFHMGGLEHSLSTLMMGGIVEVVDGFDAREIVGVLERERVGWLLLMPGVIDRFLEAAAASGPFRGVKLVGGLADLLPRKAIAEVMECTGAAFFNGLGATETGIAPLSGNVIPSPAHIDLAKRPSSLTLLRVVDEYGREVAPGEVGEILVKGPTLFSGYWNDPEANLESFREGWFRMGDLVRKNDDGTFSFVGRAKYLIKSGGENIYPAEIEKILLEHPAVLDAIVVKKRDAYWGEVPVAVVAVEGDVTQGEIDALFEGRLARYKRPKRLFFVDYQQLPRSLSGKVVRTEMEAWVEKWEASA
ncbi:MAG: long-chain-fatty-acid--CoA ligase [Porticoccaceae bacterium]|nr:MAG: long-chain-fatty-acid--CoA ligase [Porticoccaceae bacterium]